MFGYVKPYIPELRVKEKELYNAIYCGLCRSMKAHTGALSPMSLSYDYAFLAIVRSIALNENISVKPIRCAAHPIKRRAAVSDTPSLAYSAYVSALMTYYKLSDDKNDEKGSKKLRAKLLTPFASSAKKHVKDLDGLEITIISSIQRLSKLEAENSPSLDETAGTFGDILAAVFSCGTEGSDARILHEIGYHIGKYVYIADAADDADADEKASRYNPIIAAYGDSSLSEKEVTVGGKTKVKRLLSDTATSDIMRACLLELREADKAFSLLDLSSAPMLAGIADNILHLGIPKELDRILAGQPNMTASPHTEI